jgi:hypothetical protein
MSIESYIPRKDEQFRTWAEHFASVLNENPEKFMMTPSQTQAVVDSVEEFVEALFIAKGEHTRNKGTIAVKDDKRSIAETMCREWASLIKENLGISDEDKIYAGVRPINPARDPIFCPQTAPILGILGNTQGAQTLEFRDPTLPMKRSKPFGATEMQLFLAVTDGEGPAPLAEARFHLKVTRNPIAVEFGQNDNCRTATYYGRWASAKGEFGPFSQPVAMKIAA